jgi:hypothetical protein
MRRFNGDAFIDARTCLGRGGFGHVAFGGSWEIGPREAKESRSSIEVSCGDWGTGDHSAD